MKRKDVGDLGEKLAKDFLVKNGYNILETNYRCPEGELDIIATHQKYLVFVEVRTKSNLKFCSPEESVTRAKKQKLIDSAWYYRQNHEKLPQLWRIDFVSVMLGYEDKPATINLLANAVTEN
mgnify:CR=1 FL=1